MDEHQLACYPRNGTCSLRGSICCVLLTFSLSNILSKSLSHNQNLKCCSPKQSQRRHYVCKHKLSTANINLTLVCFIRIIILILIFYLILHVCIFSVIQRLTIQDQIISTRVSKEDFFYELLKTLQNKVLVVLQNKYPLNY